VGPRAGLDIFPENDDDDDNNNNNLQQPGNNVQHNVNIFLPNSEITIKVNVFAGLCVCAYACVCACVCVWVSLWALSQRLGLVASKSLRHYPVQQNARQHFKNKINLRTFTDIILNCFSDDGNSSKSCQWCSACYTVVKELHATKLIYVIIKILV
jgi:hypothetical protein